MKKIIILTDYQNRFGSKHFDTPYRSGFDKSLLKKYFNEQGYEPVLRNFAEIDFSKENFNNELVLYTSSEDDGYYYKSFIEDVVLGLELQGAIVIPQFKFLRANNNKVFMEILRDQIIGNTGLKARYFGSIEELLTVTGEFKYPVVIKTAEGASGTGVFLAHSKNELLNIAKKISRTRNFRYELWDFGRSLRHKGYLKESKYRKKIIVQEFVPNLNNDWKIYVFGNRFYIFNRPLQPGRGFRASGGGYENYFYGLNAKAPEGIFDFAQVVFNKLNVPHASLDIAYDGKDFYLIEFQCLYFGTAGILNSDEYFIKKNGQWLTEKNNKNIESNYVYSIINYINRNKQ